MASVEQRRTRLKETETETVRAWLLVHWPPEHGVMGRPLETAGSEGGEADGGVVRREGRHGERVEDLVVPEPAG